MVKDETKEEWVHQVYMLHCGTRKARVNTNKNTENGRVGSLVTGEKIAGGGWRCRVQEHVKQILIPREAY